MATEAQARADKKYEGYISRVVVKFDERYARDCALVEWARECSTSTTSYIKSLIASDLGIDDRRDWRVEVLKEDGKWVRSLGVHEYTDSTIDDVSGYVMQQVDSFTYANCSTRDDGDYMLWTIHEDGSYNREVVC